MAHYDPQIQRCRPATDRAAIEGGRLSAHVMHAAASGGSPISGIALAVHLDAAHPMARHVGDALQ
jgi:hypothetical protein